MKKIFVAIDFTEITDIVLEYAKKIARYEKGKLFIVHAETLEVYVDTNIITTPVIYQNFEEQKELMKQKLETIKDKFHKENIPCECILIEGPTVQSIIEQTEKYEADLLIIGSHKHGKLYHFLMGNIRESIISRAKCPVLVIPPLNIENE